MFKLGSRIRRDALHRWYNTSLKPIMVIMHNNELAIKTSSTILSARVFHAWKRYHAARMEVYRSKSNSIDLLWDKLC